MGSPLLHFRWFIFSTPLPPGNAAPAAAQWAPKSAPAGGAALVRNYTFL